VEAQIIVDETGHVRPIKALARELLAGLAETAEELGTKHWLDQLETWLDTAQSYLRQRAVFTETKSLREVAARLVAELDEELLIS
jgi:carboxylate-amine ligase